MSTEGASENMAEEDKVKPHNDAPDSLAPWQQWLIE